MLVPTSYLLMETTNKLRSISVCIPPPHVTNQIVDIVVTRNIRKATSPNWR
jgi:hypothetical protein